MRQTNALTEPADPADLMLVDAESGACGFCAESGYAVPDCPHCGGTGRDKGLGFREATPPTMTPGVTYERYEDMSPLGRLQLLMEEDGDVILTVVPDPKERPSYMKSVQFCMPMTGGGQSPRVRKALIALAKAIEEDNAERPQGRQERHAPKGNQGNAKD